MPPQLSGMLTLQRPAHVASVQHVLGVARVRHSCPAAHPVVPLAPQFTGWLQLFITVPHSFEPHAALVLSAAQPQAPFVHVTPPSQPMQSIELPQLSLVCSQRSLHQLGSGAPMHRPSGVHPSPGAQLPVQSQ